MPPRSLVALLLLATCCQTPKGVESGDAGLTKTPTDRLLPGELAKSALLVFGFPIPQGMTVQRRYADSVYLVGSVSLSALTAYVRAHAATGPAEIIGSRKVFAKVRIRGGDPSRLYTIEIAELGSARELTVTDVTPPPLEPGLSEAERWRRAGYLPDGTPIPSAQTF